MKCPGPVRLASLLCLLSAHATAKPWEPSPARSPHFTDRLLDLNKTADLVLDTRTPPKVKLQQKQKETIEHSHAGVAVPIDEDSVLLEATTKKINFYKIEKPPTTTTSGLSTWILLSGQTVAPPKTGSSNATEAPIKISKPIFKKRTTTTAAPPSLNTTTPHPTNVTKLDKIKASVLAGAKKSTTTTELPSTTTATLVKIEATEPPERNATVETDSQSLPPEAKEGDSELPTTTAKPKKPRRPTNKRKKNGNRKRRPANKSANSTEVSKPDTKEEVGFGPVYNYLKKRVMPTIEAGLVGLMVTAGLGLAGYFLYPFGAARRTYEVDRRDKGTYYYSDDYYSGGMAEEEAIGKVIAGMQLDTYENTYSGNKYKKAYPNVQYRQVDKDVVEQSKETSYSVAGHRRKELYPEVAPVTVPEHGPRDLKLRRRREVDDAENDVFADLPSKGDRKEETSTRTPEVVPHVLAPVKSFLTLLKDFFQMRVRV